MQSFTTPYISIFFIAVIPAKVDRIERIFFISPKNKNTLELFLASCHLLNTDMILNTGSVQAMVDVTYRILALKVDNN